VLRRAEDLRWRKSDDRRRRAEDLRSRCGAVTHITDSSPRRAPALAQVRRSPSPARRASAAAAHVRWRKCRPCSRAHVGTHRVRRAALLWGCTSRRRVPVQGDLRRRRSRRVLHAVRRRASAAAGRPRAALGGWGAGREHLRWRKCW